MNGLSEEKITALFDQLVSEGVIIYGPHTKHEIDAEGYPFEFRICPALSTKPHTITSTNPAFTHTRKWGPGSDMYCPDERLILTQLNATHDLALNLFCVDRPQLLMLTLNSYKRQHEPLDADDFKVMLELLSWEGWYVIFNCGERGGCSRVHKHLQGLKGMPYAFEAFKKGQSHVPFKFYMHSFESKVADVKVEDIQRIYEDILVKCRIDIGLEQGEVCPHNVVLWDRWMIVIPRRKGVWEGASANSGGMMGSVWVPNQTEVDKWLEVGCANVLRELGVPA